MFHLDVLHIAMIVGLVWCAIGVYRIKVPKTDDKEEQEKQKED